MCVVHKLCNNIIKLTVIMAEHASKWVAKWVYDTFQLQLLTHVVDQACENQPCECKLPVH